MPAGDPSPSRLRRELSRDDRALAVAGDEHAVLVDRGMQRQDLEEVPGVLDEGREARDRGRRSPTPRLSARTDAMPCAASSSASSRSDRDERSAAESVPVAGAGVTEQQDGRDTVRLARRGQRQREPDAGRRRRG